MNHLERSYLRLAMGPIGSRVFKAILRRIFNRPKWFDPEALSRWRT